MKKKYASPIITVQIIGFENCITASSAQITPGGNDGGSIFIDDEIIQEGNEVDWSF